MHFHDIYFPYDYARDTLDGDMLFPQESGLLYAFLAGNPRFHIEVGLSLLHYARPNGIAVFAIKFRRRTTIGSSPSRSAITSTSRSRTKLASNRPGAR